MSRRKAYVRIVLGCLLLGLVLMLVPWGLFFVESDEHNGIMHISFDDTIEIFKDITKNENEYNEIFDNEMLSYLKKYHEKYGAVFSFYCYYTDGDFDLTQCTDKFVEDFQANSSWLKFAFHSYDGNSDLTNATAEEALRQYSMVTEELIRITGGGECIDSVPRLHRFAGNEEAIDAINELEYGIDGLYTADDERQSYYLEESDSNYVADHDTYYDKNNDLLFVSTDLRLEETNLLNLDRIMSSILKDSNQNKVVEVFTHEWQWGLVTKIKLYYTCFWGQTNGYTWEYASDIKYD